MHYKVDKQVSGYFIHCHTSVIILDWVPLMVVVMLENDARLRMRYAQHVVMMKCVLHWCPEPLVQPAGNMPKTSITSQHSVIYRIMDKQFRLVFKCHHVRGQTHLVRDKTTAKRKLPRYLC